MLRWSKKKHDARIDSLLARDCSRHFTRVNGKNIYTDGEEEKIEKMFSMRPLHSGLEFNFPLELSSLRFGVTGITFHLKESRYNETEKPRALRLCTVVYDIVRQMEYRLDHPELPNNGRMSDQDLDFVLLQGCRRTTEKPLAYDMDPQDRLLMKDWNSETDLAEMTIETEDSRPFMLAETETRESVRAIKQWQKDLPNAFAAGEYAQWEKHMEDWTRESGWGIVHFGKFDRTNEDNEKVREHLFQAYSIGRDLIALDRRLRDVGHSVERQKEMDAQALAKN